MAAPIKMKYSDYQKMVNNGGKLLPRTDYNFTQNFGNDQAMLKAITPIAQKAGYVRDDNMSSSHFRSAENAKELASVKPYKYESPKAPSGGYNLSYSYKPMANIGGFAPSEAYNQAMAYTQNLLEQLNSGRTKYSDKVDELMAKIEGRDKFSYDFNTDPLFQNALASAMASGQTAMQDTIGQASSLTGGYGSSYATSAGNQAYNEYIKDAYDSLPDYYNIALNAYNTEGQEMYNQLGMYQTADDTAYSRLANAYNANFNQAESLYNKEYSNYWDTANYNRAVDEYNADMAYKSASLAANNAYKAAQLKEASTGTSSETATLSDSQWKNLKSEGAKIAEKSGVDSNNFAEWIQLQESLYGPFSDDQIRDLYSYADANVPATQLSLQNKNGSYVYTDQYGKPYQSADRTLVKTKTASQKANDEYTDAYNNTYTRSQLEAIYGKNWEKYVKSTK